MRRQRRDDDAKRQALGGAIAQEIRLGGYTVWACAVLKNHLHLRARRHRDDAATMWARFAAETTARLRLFPGVGPTHPVWSGRPY